MATQYFSMIRGGFFLGLKISMLISLYVFPCVCFSQEKMKILLEQKTSKPILRLEMKGPNNRARSSSYPPIYDVELFENRIVRFNGIRSTKLLGIQEYRISQEKYDAVMKALEKSRFFEMPTYIGNGDHSTLRLSIQLNAKENSIEAGAFGFGWPNELYELLWAVQDDLEIFERACLPDSDKPSENYCVQARAIQQQAKNSTNWSLFK